MKSFNVLFGVLLIGAAIPYLFIGLAMLTWGDLLFMHQPDDLIGEYSYLVIRAYSGISILLIPVFAIVQAIRMIRKKIKLFSWELISILLLGGEFVLFISIRSKLLLWYVD